MDPSYTLDFIISDGGSVLLPLYDNFYNEWSYLPTNSTKTGYNLIGWTINGINVYYDATVNLHYINFFWSVQGNLVAYPIRELKTYDIVFNIEGDIYNKTATYNTLFTVPLPVKSGFTFEGWYNTSSSDLLLNEFIWTWDYNRNFESNWIQNTETSNINNAETFRHNISMKNIAINNKLILSPNDTNLLTDISLIYNEYLLFTKDILKKDIFINIYLSDYKNSIPSIDINIIISQNINNVNIKDLFDIEFNKEENVPINMRDMYKETVTFNINITVNSDIIVSSLNILDSAMVIGTNYQTKNNIFILNVYGQILGKNGQNAGSDSNSPAQNGGVALSKNNNIVNIQNGLSNISGGNGGSGSSNTVTSYIGLYYIRTEEYIQFNYTAYSNYSQNIAAGWQQSSGSLSKGHNPVYLTQLWVAESYIPGSIITESTHESIANANTFLPYPYYDPDNNGLKKFYTYTKTQEYLDLKNNHYNLYNYNHQPGINGQNIIS
jgi:hypothetical protein